MPEIGRTDTPIRRLTAQDLGLAPQVPQSPGEGGAATDVGIADDDPLFLRTRELLEYYGGVIFVGPPGTSKTFYAQNIAVLLAGGDETLVRFVQFHPSYQYEDFVQGFVPTPRGFELRPKHLLDMCRLARENESKTVVLVIDELSRGDPGRIFGEALTYVEKTKRGLAVRLASGDEVSMPHNLVFLCTMNPLDRGVDEVDAAFERRFAKIAMEPDPTILEQMIVAAGMPDRLRARVRRFFEWANARTRMNPFGAIGHTFFLDIFDEEGLRRLWNHQLRFLFEKAYQLDPEGYTEVERRWQQNFQTQAASGEPMGDVVTVGEAGAETEGPVQGSP